MPVSSHSVYLNGVKTRELERRASMSALAIEDNLDSDHEFADLVAAIHQMSIEPKHTVRAWTSGRVPYTISTKLQQNHPDICKTLKSALKMFRRQVESVKWNEREDEADFVKFVYNKSKCSSRVGCVGGQQKIKLPDRATPGNVLHEMGHAIGLHHEHCRPDRDHFVKAHKRRIQKGKGHNFDIKGIPLGPYDYSSIMHYGTRAFSIDGRPTIVPRPIKGSDQIGQRKKFSEMDLKGIEAIYGPLKCSFEQYGDVYWPQIWFECLICWGDESNYGCCLMCALDCHSGPDHLLVPHQLSPNKTFVCDCGRNHHQPSVCTWHSTETKNVKQPFYNCRDCFKNSSQSCCYQCMQKCHAGHNTKFAGIMKGYCDCGLEHCRSGCLIPKPLTCTYESHGENYHKQYWYQCYTCWGHKSNYGCCSYCAFNCHKDHDLVYRPGREVTAVCDCGRNDHQQAVCTWHSTETKNVKQPFYNCRDCFKNSSQSCCYQCMQKCHAGHNTKFAGIMKGYCDCGLEHCRSGCLIPKPLTCTYESHGENYHKQYWYQCYTCWGGKSNYGCCSYCAFNCHKDHDLVYRPGKKVTAVCDCGRNEHQQSVCTWHSTERKYVKQPFYHCNDCFKNPHAKCCYQCEKTCHADHNTVYVGTTKGYCKCGMKCCRKSCRIEHPAC